jgi:phosphatidylserine synthase 2
MSSNFLGGFFIINSLWIPPKNFINVYRLSVWFLLGSIAIGELYDDVDSWGTPQRQTTPISNEFRY